MNTGERERPDESKANPESGPANRQSADKGGGMQAPLDQVKRLIRIGTALSAERNLERLFEMIIEAARSVTRADGGTLYIMSDDEKELQFAIVQTESLRVRMGGQGERITWKPVSLHHPDGTPNHGNVSAHVALSGRTVNIPDVYDAAGFDFKGTRAFDTQTGYRSRSMLVVPMKNHHNDIIGVLQLLNARGEEGAGVIPFTSESQELTESLASQAAIALSNNRLIHDLENLMESFIRTIATAIDEKSPYTGGHVRRVADLTMELAGRINETREGPYGAVQFSDDELRELHIAAWLHDVGKITTPEYVVDKSTKLQALFDRIELLRIRFSLCALQEGAAAGDGFARQRGSLSGSARGDLGEEFRFLREVNQGGEQMSEAMLARIRGIAARTWDDKGTQIPLLSDEEVKQLSIRQGTLTGEEREIIKNHASVTCRMLRQLPFPKNLRHVPEYAGMHHESLNGKGYPRGLAGDQIPLQSRILALADVFEALTAKDRPYKKGKTLSEAMQIMRAMVKERHIDADLFALFEREGIYLDYARRELAPQQIDLPAPEGSGPFPTQEAKGKNR